MTRKLFIAAPLAGLVSLASIAVRAEPLPPLSCQLVHAPGALCKWTPGGTCTWEEGGTPTLCAPKEGARVRLRTAGTYRGGFNNASAANGIAYDPPSQRLFVANTATSSVDVVDLSGGVIDANRPRRLSKACSIPLGYPDPKRLWLRYAPTFLALRPDGLLAVVLQQFRNPIGVGKVAFLRIRGHCDADIAAVVDVGNLPSRGRFTPDGSRFVVPNQGEPWDNYLIDPLGTVSIVHLEHGLSKISTKSVDFRRFNWLKFLLTASGVRITGPNLHTPDPSDTTSVARDLEPEGIVIAPDSRTAWVTLPENNSVAVLDLAKERFIAIRSLGLKSFNQAGNGLDPTDNDGNNGGSPVNIGTWPIEGMYMPKQLALFEHDGDRLFLLANDGARRNYGAFHDEVRLSDLPLDKPPVFRDLDPNVFPPGDPLTNALRNLQLKISWPDGDDNGDGYLDRIVAFGGRSFSIRRDDGSVVYDSGDDIEQITAQAWRDTGGYFLFNTPDDENRLDDVSDLRGPEPSSVAVGEIARRTYAFVGLERTGGVMAYDITDPAAPAFQVYINNRNFALNPKDGEGICFKRLAETAECANVGDLSAEELVFVRDSDSPIGKPLLLVSNATSGSATVFVIEDAH